MLAHTGYRNGFWLLMKRLEQDRFIWPDAASVPKLTVEELHWLLDGLDLAVEAVAARSFEICRDRITAFA